MPKFTKVPGRDIGDIRMYTLSTCGWCKKTKAFFSDNKIGYSYIDVDLLAGKDLDPVREEQLKYNPSGSFPTIVIDSGNCIVGYDEEKLKSIAGK